MYINVIVKDVENAYKVFAEKGHTVVIDNEEIAKDMDRLTEGRGVIVNLTFTEGDVAFDLTPQEAKLLGVETLEGSYIKFYQKYIAGGQK